MVIVSFLLTLNLMIMIELIYHTSEIITIHLLIFI